MVEARWIAAGLLFVFAAMCWFITVGIAVRYYRTGKSGSGLPFVGSVAAFLGLLVLPLGTMGQRASHGLLPVGFEFLLLAFLVVLTRRNSSS